VGEYQAVPLNFVMRTEVRGESRIECWDRFEHNIVNIVANCVQQSTQGTYAVGWERWVKFNNWFGTHPYLESIPIGWQSKAGSHYVKFKDFVVVSFIQKLCMEEGLCPGTVSVYLSAVRYYFRLHNLDITFLESPWISAARTGINLIYRATHPIAERKALPFVCEMIMHAESVTFNTESDHDLVIVTAFKIASVLMMRVSEYLPGAKGVEHWLRSDDVAFRLWDNRIIPSWRAYLHEWKEVQSVLFHVRGAKNDVVGEGHRFDFPAVAANAERAYDIAYDCFKWAIRARPLMGHPFLSFRGDWVLKYHTLTAAVKKVAVEMGFDPSKFRTHSLRIGGASMLAAANVPDYVIQVQGRWKSLAFLDYIRIAKRSFDSALAAIVNMDGLTICDVRRMSATAEWT
jgi:hypothetical protein